MPSHSRKKTPKRLIEVDFPIGRISTLVRGERNLLSPLHVWWARRPLGVCRVVICASLWFDPADDHCPESFREAAKQEMEGFARKVISRQSFLETLKSSHWSILIGNNMDAKKVAPDQLRELLLDFIAGFASAKASEDEMFLAASRRLTETSHRLTDGIAGSKPFVLDPFAGGGSIPFEALRVGAQSFAGDLNPIAVLLNKAALEYGPRYGRALGADLRSLTYEIHTKVARDCAKLYRSRDDKDSPIAYLWARTIVCEGPGCGCEVPVLRSLWIDQSRRSTSAYELVADEKNEIRAKIVQSPERNRVASGTSRRGSVTCPCCGYTTARKRIERQANSRGLGQKLLAVVVDAPGGREYREPNATDLAAVAEAEELCGQRDDWGGEFSESLPYLSGIFNVHVYGLRTWRQLFSSRQYFYLSTLARYFSDTFKGMNPESEKDKALLTLVGFVIAKTARVSCNLARWRNDSGRIEAAFSMMALPMVWDWAEWNPFNPSMHPFSTIVEGVANTIERTQTAVAWSGTTEQVNATTLPLPDDSAALFFTDPPYYDYVPYANLSDFSYVWLRRTLGDWYPNFFVDCEAPKDEEIVQLAERNPLYAHKTKEFFEEQIELAFVEGRRVTDPQGLGVIVFAHKSTEVWETLLSAVIRAGWIITASWPIDTELATRFKAINTASLVSSIHLVCRPRERLNGSLQADDVGEWRSVLRELPVRIHNWMPQLAREGVVGADAIFACLGPALEIFSQYSRVEKASGENVELKEYLEHVWAAVAREALSMIFEDADASNLEADARLTAMWLWTLCTSTNANAGIANLSSYSQGKKETPDEKAWEVSHKARPSIGFTLDFDAARKIAQGLGVHLTDVQGIVEIKGDRARLKAVSERTIEFFGKRHSKFESVRPTPRTNEIDLFDELSEEGDDKEWGEVGLPNLGVTTLDRVHQAMVLFSEGRTEAVRLFLVEEGVGRDSRFWKLSQCLSALYPIGTDEKRWIDGVLARKKGLGF